MRNLSHVFMFLIAAALVACGGGGAGAPLPPTNVPHLQKSVMHVRILVPKRLRRHGKVKIGPHWISPSTVSFEFVLNNVNGLAVPTGFTATKYLNLSGCTDVSGTYTCNLLWVVPAASNDNFTVSEWDGTSGTGNKLGTNTLAQAVAAGSSNLSITLDGIPASITAVPASPNYFTGSAPNYQVLGAATPWPITVTVKDADGNSIVGPGAPQVTVSPASGNYTGSAATYGSSTMTVTPIATNGPIGSTAITFQATGLYTGGATVSTSLNLSTYLPKGFASGSPAGTTIGIYSPQNVAMALAGATGVTPAGTLAYGASVTTLGTYFDSSGNFYLGVAGGVDIWTAAQIASCVAGCTNVAPVAELKYGGASNIDCVTRDASGNLWAAISGLYVNSIAGWKAATVTSGLGGTTASAADARLSTATHYEFNTNAHCLLAGSGGALFASDYSTIGGATQAENWKPATLSTALTNGSTAVGSDGTISNGAGTGQSLTMIFDGSDLVLDSSVGGSTGVYLDIPGTIPTTGSLVGPTGSFNLGTSRHGYGLASDPANDLFVSANDGTNQWVFGFTSTAVSSAAGGSSAVSPVGWFGPVSGSGDLAYDQATGSLLLFDGNAPGHVQVFWKTAVANLLTGTTGGTYTGTLAAGGEYVNMMP